VIANKASLTARDSNLKSRIKNSTPEARFSKPRSITAPHHLQQHCGIFGDDDSADEKPDGISEQKKMLDWTCYLRYSSEDMEP